MKSILYAGATLMIGASIYGFVDYKNTSHKKEFVNMYNESVKEKTIKETTPAKNEAKKQTSLNDSETVAAKQEVVADKPADVKKITKKVSVKKEEVLKTKKRKKINREIFSRAPIREDFDEIELLPVPSDSEIKKTDNNEL